MEFRSEILGFGTEIQLIESCISVTIGFGIPVPLKKNPELSTWKPDPVKPRLFWIHPYKGVGGRSSEIAERQVLPQKRESNQGNYNSHDGNTAQYQV